MRKGVDHIGVTLVYFCHDGQGNFLMSLRSQNARDEQGRWDIGGGALEFGHTVEETLRKEIREEYCTDVLASEFLGYRDICPAINSVKAVFIPTPRRRAIPAAG